MKRTFLVIALIVILAVPAFTQVRIDLGVMIPRGGGLLSGGEVSGTSEVADALRDYILPFPEASVYYQWNLGPVNMAAGARIFTFILESVFWPNLLAEVQLGPVFIDGQLGGLLFGMFGLVNSFDAGAVFIPDLSVWLGVGKKKNLRFGVGAMGLMAPEVSGSDMLMVFYFGGKVSIYP